ncbi:N-acetyl-gamma-glutamyl-phosphate reductase [Carboxylicivirga sediminis]|uniref:N-acetyl-gamma-glutamyl-phosphate reductase n=1 Tax=Carboxylicivirga sediminis TaxID=2006564 RepID=A0A941F768_9BACT|nr:N-acetyl-gamma-glutamyl-phosphate reductase [Carboxylicivirga sediminis]MBR8536570.1 N-acetyl-gamma-glutamyl-phosphate reductase [Carboxylicivirga sediminis]
MIKVGIIGGAGYTAGELIRILLNHPKAEITYAQSTSQAGLPVSSIHTDLVGETELSFVAEADYEVDVLFLCMGHGRSRSFVEAIPADFKGKIIDLSNDYRLKETADGFVYGLPELNKKRIQKADKIANPGCFATAIQVALLPLAEAGKLKEVHVHAITGSTGAGQACSGTTHFSWRNNNASVYKSFSHQHLGEIGESLVQLQPAFADAVNFVPMRGNYPRGILASVYLETELEENAAQELYEHYYAAHPFTHVVRNSPDVKQVVNTNRALVSVKKHGTKLHIISVIDNLLKGASGQAVQNMNLLFGLDEAEGLRLKPVAF